MPGNTYTFAKEITTTTGTTLVLDLTALDEMAAFQDLFTHGQLVRYSLKSANGDIETGVGTYNANNNTFERTQIDSTFIAGSGVTNTTNPTYINLQYPSELFGILSSVSGGINPVYAAAGVNVDESSILSILGSTDIGKGASLIAIRNTPKLYQTATNVEGALAEVWNATSSASASAALAQSSANSAQTTANNAQSQVNTATTTANQALSQSQTNATAISQLQTNQSSVVYVGVLQSNTAGQGASTVGIQDAGNYYASTNVEGALQEVMQVAKNNSGAQVTQLRTDLASTATNYGASLIGVDNSSNLFNSTTVQGVLVDVSNRLAANISSTSSNTSNISTLTTTTNNNTTAINARAVSADLASTAASKGASLIGIQDTGNLYTSTTVEAALQEVMTAANNAAQSTSLKNALAGTANGQGAQMIGLYNPDTLISSVDVYHALREIATNVQTNKGNITTNTSNISTNTTNIATTSTNLTNYKSDIASTAAGKGSALVGFNNPQGKFSTASTTVELALDEAMSVANGAQTGTGSLGTDLASNATGKGASLVAVNNDSALFTSTSTVQSVLQSLQTSVNQNTSNISSTSTNLSNYVLKTDLNSSGAGLGASMVGYVDTNAFYASANLQGALDVISTHLKNDETNIATNSQFDSDLGNTASGKGAAKVAVQSGGNFTSTTVQGALNELYTAAHAHDNQVVPAPSSSTINQMLRINNAGTAYELIDAPTMRSNLGLGTAATMSAGSFAQVGQSNTWQAAQVIPKVITTFTAGTNNVLYGNAGVVVCDASGGSIILNLPAASVGTVEYQFVRKDTTTNSVTIQRAGTDTLDGSGSQFALTGRLDQRRVISDGTSNWTTVDSAQGNPNVTYQVANATANNHAVNYGQINGVYAPLASPNLTGVPLAPTAAAGTNTTQIATTAFVTNATSGLLTSNNPTFSGTATFNDNLATGSGYGIDIVGSVNSTHDLLRVQQASFSQGFTVQYNNTSMVYTFNDGTVTHNAGSLVGIQINNSTGAVGAISLTRTDASKTVTAWNNGSRWQFSDGIDTSAVNVGGNAVWHAGNFTPGNYALLTGANFTGVVQVTAQGVNGFMNLSGVANNWTSYALGRTAVEGRLGVVGVAGNFANDSNTGDIVVQNLSGGTAAVRILSGTSTTAIAVNGSGISFGYMPTVNGYALASSNSPAFTGTPTAPTPAAGTTTQQLATCAYLASNYAPLNSPSFTGTPSTPTASNGDNSTRIASTQFVQSALSGMMSPTLVTASSTLTATANNNLITVDASAGAMTLTLPAASARPGIVFNFIRKDTTSNSVTIQRAGSDLFDSGQSAVSLATQGDFRSIQSDGSSTWRTIATSRDLSLTGNPTATTPTAGDNSGKIATTAFVQGAVQNGQGINTTVTSITATGTLSTTNFGLIVVDATSGAITLTLPAASAKAGAYLSLVRKDASANAITIQRAGSDTIDAGTSFTLGNQGDWHELQSDGSSVWRTVGSNRDVQLTGNPTAPTPATSDNDTSIATTQFVKAQNYLTGNQTISVSGDATGSGATAIALTLANSGVSAGTYNSVTVDAKGRVTGGSNQSYAPTASPTFSGTVGMGSQGAAASFALTTGAGSPQSARLLYGTDGSGWMMGFGKNQGGTITTQMNLKDNGNVSIANGTGDLGYTLGVNGSGYFASALYAPTASRGTSNTQVATTAYVRASASLRRVGATTYAASVTLDPNNSDFFTVTLTGNITINMTTSGEWDGQACTIRLTQDGTGGRSVTWGTGVGLGADLSTTSLSTAANKTDYVGLVYSAAAAKWHVVSFLRGY